MVTIGGTILLLAGLAIGVGSTIRALRMVGQVIIILAAFGLLVRWGQEVPTRLQALVTQAIRQQTNKVTVSAERAEKWAINGVRRAFGQPPTPETPPAPPEEPIQLFTFEFWTGLIGLAVAGFLRWVVDPAWERYIATGEPWREYWFKTHPPRR